MIQEICAYIDANLSEDLSIDRLSERFHLSASSLRKVFRNEVGMTPKVLCWEDENKYIGTKTDL